jgi:hypothetical protein
MDETLLQHAATLQELLRKSENLQLQSARVIAESKELEARCAAVIAHAKRLWCQRND